MTAIRDHLGIHADALILREARTRVLGSNIANAATPNFKARDFDFTRALDEARGEPEATMRTHSRHLSGSGGLASGEMGYRVPVNPSLDGNTVELAVEQMEFAENTLRYQVSLTLLNRKISGLTKAIKGE
ncbi:flagellar basal-body rod protein FlgB [Rhodovulum bhavnagarense]|uniref:Flagellar basal body rod protein FlgB n=1 Tax=Rhodovulum bhavnagarense TaxID=992286 RepID=A0A4R2RD53_9RHOB|nr:flagellar basal body rod protein FlgB [Rhodovulum bhavnagarense]TCP61352.1 flagellar basal-body rod protein FlgB [Rhodovulum bhavnagarense]